MTAPDPFTARAEEIFDNWKKSAPLPKSSVLVQMLASALRSVHADAFGAGVEAAAKAADLGEKTARDGIEEEQDPDARRYCRIEANYAAQIAEQIRQLTKETP